MATTNQPKQNIEKQIVDQYLYARIEFFILCAQAATNNKFDTATYLVFNHLYKIPLPEIVEGIAPARRVLNDIRSEVQYSDAQLDAAHALMVRFYPGIIRNPQNISLWLDDLMKASEVVLADLEALKDGEILKRLNNGQPLAAGEKEWLSIKLAEKMYYSRIAQSPGTIV